MLWITDSMGRLWQAYKDGLALSCPLYRDCARSAQERRMVVNSPPPGLHSRPGGRSFH